MDYQKIVEILFSFGLIINAVLYVPQILKLFKTKNPEGVSLLAFVGFNCIQILGILHCYYSNDYPPMVGWAASLVTSGCITFLMIRYLYQGSTD